MADPTTETPYVFISYASVNRERVIEIVDSLGSTGIGVWFDRSDIPGGTSYGPEIVSGIKNAAALVLMCSEASLASRNVRQEIQLAWRHERPILPLLLEPLIFPDDVSYWLEGAQWIEVLDSGPDVWLDQVHYGLTLMGYAGLAKRAESVKQPPSVLVELPPNNLPESQTPLIGRERELRQLRSLLEHASVLTLTGTGGSGKTHLADQAARESAVRFSDGLCFIDAAATRDAASLIEAIAAALEIQEAPGESLIDTVNARLGGRQTLLILDNLEQNEFAGEVVNALTAQEGPVVLATSRSPIRATGEMVVPVSPLESPDPQPNAPASVIARNPAVQLFLERARQVKPDFQLSDGNAFEVATICAKLDGLPLAIELAAARSRLLHPAALLARLDSRLTVLTRGSGRSARQQTLQSTIAWSYDLLGPVEQAVFRRTGVFAGGASLELTEEVVAASSDDVARDEVLDAIDELIDHSLLEVDQTHSDDDSTRVKMLETIREFAVAMLSEAGELHVTSLAHARAVSGIVEELEPQLEAGQQALALSRLSREQVNIAVAFRFLVESPDPAHNGVALGMAGSLWRYWWMRGHYSEGRRLIESALATSPETSEHRIRALNGAGVMAFSTGDLQGASAFHAAAATLSEELGLDTELARSRDNLGIVSLTSGAIEAAIEQFQSALHHYRNSNDQRGIGLALEHLAAATISKGDLERAGELARKALAVRRSLGNQQLIGYSLQQLGIIAMYSGKYEEARGYYSQAQALAESLDDSTGLANTLINLASATEMLGEYDRARDLLQQSLRLYQELEDAGGIGYTHYMLGHVARSSGQPNDAETHLNSALRQLLDVGELDSVALCLETLAGVRIDLREFETATRMLGAAHEVRQTTGAAVPGTREAELASDYAAVKERLSEQQFLELFEAGRTTQPVAFNPVAEQPRAR